MSRRNRFPTPPSSPREDREEFGEEDNEGFPQPSSNYGTIGGLDSWEEVDEGSDVDVGIILPDTEDGWSQDKLEEIITNSAPETCTPADSDITIHDLLKPYPEIKFPEDYMAAIQKALEYATKNVVGKFPFGINTQTRESQMLYVYSVAEQLTVLSLSPQFKQDERYVKIFKEHETAINNALREVKKLLPQSYQELLAAETMLLKCYNGIMPSGMEITGDDNYERALIRALNSASEYVGFVDIAKKTKEDALKKHNLTEESLITLGLDIGSAIAELEQQGNDTFKVTYKSHKNNVISAYAGLRTAIVKIRPEAVEEFDKIRGYDTGNPGVGKTA